LRRRIRNCGSRKSPEFQADFGFEVELVLQDQSGKTIGAVGIVFNYDKGKEAEFQKNAEQIRDEMKQKTPTIGKLFEAAE